MKISKNVCVLSGKRIPVGQNSLMRNPVRAGFMNWSKSIVMRRSGIFPRLRSLRRPRGLKVLEIGCGLGTDGAQFAKAGADYTGVDLTEAAVELARKRFELSNLPGKFQTADAENLEFDDNSFDLVYSHGVLHHTPDTARAVKEIHRVLRPGGRAVVMLYHRDSYNYRVNISVLRRAGARLLKSESGIRLVQRITGEPLESLREHARLLQNGEENYLKPEEFLSQNTDGAGNPLARVYSRREALELFKDFSDVNLQTHFLNKRWLPVVGKFVVTLFGSFARFPLGLALVDICDEMKVWSLVLGL